MVNFENLIRTSALTVNWLVYQHLLWSTVAFSLHPPTEIIIEAVYVESVKTRNSVVGDHDT